MEPSIPRRSIFTRCRHSRARLSFFGLDTISVVLFCIVLALHLRSVNAVKLQGGSALALAGKGCVVLAMDQRVGTSGQLLLGGDGGGEENDAEGGTSGSQRVLKVNGRLLLGMVGYDSMARAFFDLLQAELYLRSMRLQHHALGETSTAISPKALSLLVSHLLYFKFRGSGTAPIIAGLDQDGTSVLCTQDSLGAYSFQADFVALGSSAKSLLGACEALYRPNLEGEALMELACRCLRAGLERDCVSGYGIVVYLVTKQGVARTRLQGRMD
ncbi:hypothetical protein VYU27_001036 [Nannochloropsis oceanica]